MCFNHIFYNEKGFVLPIGMMFLAVLAVVGITAAVFTTTDLKIGENYKNSVVAFQNADSGVNFAVQSIENGRKNNTFSLPVNVGDTVSLGSFTVPSGFSFQLSDITKTGVNAFTFSSTGSSGSSFGSTTITAGFKQGSAINFAAFGDVLADLKAYSNVYSYDSRVCTPTAPIVPAVCDTTGEGDLGSNGEVSVKQHTFVDGDVALGDDGMGTEGVYTETGSPIITGIANEDIERVDPDPLGLISGDYATKMAFYSANNDNASAGAAIVGTKLGLGSSYGISTVTLTAGNYYLTEIDLKTTTTLNIDSSAGDVNIWLQGPCDVKNGATINVTGNPTDFALFSDSTDPIVFKHGSDFKGLIYAPLATVDMRNSGNIWGAVWASTVKMHNTASIFYDTALRDKYQSKEIIITTWKEELG